MISVGAHRPPFNDAVGTLVTTGVLVKSPSNPLAFPELLYRPSRVDLLMFTPDLQPNRAGLSDLCVTLYSDDGSDVHNPGVQVCVFDRYPFETSLETSLSNVHPFISLQLANPFAMTAATAPLQAQRASWYQVDISTAGWPLMSPVTYYWVVVTPCSPLTMTTQGGAQYNGAAWAGTDDSINPIPGAAAVDRLLFRGRQLSSQRFKGDTALGANTPAAVAFNRDTESWGDISPPQYTNWDAEGSTIRYGIQLLGWQVQPPVTLSSE